MPYRGFVILPSLLRFLLLFSLSLPVLHLLCSLVRTLHHMLLRHPTRVIRVHFPCGVCRPISILPSFPYVPAILRSYFFLSFMLF